MNFRKISILAVAVAFLTLVPSRRAAAQEQSASQPSQQSETKKENNKPPEHKGMAGELVEETRESTGEDQEEYSNLKHASVIRWMAAKTGMSIHQAHMTALFINFAVILPLAYWVINKLVFAFTGQKSLKDLFRSRSATIQRSLEEARTASQEANRRLADIETRLRQLDVEIGQMQASAEKEADAEENRIQKAAEEDIRKVVLAAEHEIAAAGKQARRELATHTAGLAIALARKQINVDSATDQMLVRSFATTLASGEAGTNSEAGTNANNDNNRGKDRR